ncbi:MAG: hypothetical protein DRP71_09815 [Verrucomicrobia bacterium]|nr:MAG: hypothetical protein DRP71_09815 [Verrucomicrobiota bacterium]
MKPSAAPFLSLPILFILISSVGLAWSGWELWETIVLNLILFGAVATYLAPKLPVSAVGHDAEGVVITPSRPDPVQSEGPLTESSGLITRSRGDDECTIWDCF